MSTVMDEGQLLLALADPTLAQNTRKVLTVLADSPDQATLDGLAIRCEARYGIGRRWVFYAVGLLEERGWLPPGQIR